MTRVINFRGDTVTLRDGTSVLLRVAQPADHEAMQRFFHDLSPQSRWWRFFSASDPDDRLIRKFCDSADPHRQVTIMAFKADDPAEPIALASYVRVASDVAEAAFTVEDAFQGKGLGTVLLNRIAELAAANGFHRLESVVLRDNLAMLDVLRHSGFEMQSPAAAGNISMQLSVRLPAA
jgi:RimJ/RimL family protein N-acetyltransferase